MSILVGPAEHCKNLIEALSTIHGNFTKLEEADFYPEHDKRKSSKSYREVHRKLVVEQDAPCLVCGVTHSILMDEEKVKNLKLNPYQSTQIELHHHTIEWSLANAIDVDKFNQKIRLALSHQQPNNKLYQRPMNQKEILDWVDHGQDNLWALCDVHHRHKYFGIHQISYPHWGPQDLYTQAFIDELNEKIKEHEQ